MSGFEAVLEERNPRVRPPRVLEAGISVFDEEGAGARAGEKEAAAIGTVHSRPWRREREREREHSLLKFHLCLLSETINHRSCNLIT